jgi:hypothetical protein
VLDGEQGEIMHVSIVGAGLGGLATAALLKQRGVQVTLLDRAHPGGRARSGLYAGARVNLGPHALYVRSGAASVLGRLGIVSTGGVPPTAGTVLRGGALHALPGGPLSYVQSGALTAGEKLRLPGWLAVAPTGGTVAEWLAPAPAGIRDLLSGLVRVSSYAEAPGHFAAPAAFRQLRRAFGGVRYLDGGWQQLVDALLALAGPAVQQEVVDLRALPPGPVVVAGPPSLPRALGVPVTAMVQARAACLDLVLRNVPNPAARFVLGLDAPLYLAEHGSLADLGGAVLHVARYLAPGESGDTALPGREALLDLAQPGWRDEVLWRRFAPALVASHRVDQPGERVPGVVEAHGRRIHLVGDWVGEAAMLADRAFASAAAAADALLVQARAAA